MTRVLVADIPEMDGTIRDCLPGHDLTYVRSMREAIGALRRDGFGLIVIGLHFDESRMIELLSYIRTLEKYRDAPVVCVQGVEAALPDSARRSIDMAVRALGGLAFLDLREGSQAFRHHCSALAWTAVSAS